MTREEKVKAYDNALEKVQLLYKQAKKDDNPIFSTYEYLFPELREIEDKRIRQWLYNHFKDCPFDEYVGVSKKEVLEWLERQGTGDSHKENEDKCVCSDIEIEDDCQHHHFEVGDWIVDEDGNLFYVYDKSGNTYFLEGNFGAPYAVPVDEQYKYHIWTFEDAKNGDVLVSDADEIVLFNEKLNESSFYPYCHIEPADNESGWQFFDDTNDEDVWFSNYFKPAKNATRKIFYGVIEKNGITTQRY